MTIRDIASIAGVSVSTVSKVLNKSSDISRETSERVLGIIQENNFIPYSRIRKRIKSETNYIGIVLDEFVPNPLQLIRGIEETLLPRGYTLASRLNSKWETVGSTITTLLHEGVCGLILSGASRQVADLFSMHDVAFSYLRRNANLTTIPGALLPLRECAANAARMLLDHGHRAIILVLPSDNPKEIVEEIYTGFLDSLREYGEVANEKLIVSLDPNQVDRILCPNLDRLLHGDAQAILCLNETVANTVYCAADRLGLKIPNDISVAAAFGETAWPFMRPVLKCNTLQMRKIGIMLANQIIDQLEGTSDAKELVDILPVANEGASVALTEDSRRRTPPTILIVGSMNMDVEIQMPAPLQIGSIISVSEVHSFPGGKGANQAIAVARLGGNAVAFGSIGNDAEGMAIRREIEKNEVHTEGVVVDNVHTTGKAYMHVFANGDFNTIYHPGANVENQTKLLENFNSASKDSRFCLLSCGIHQDSVKRVLQITKHNGIRTILKPSPLWFEDELLDKVFLFIPNDMEATQYAGAGRILKEQAEHFLGLGAENVIITLGMRGCYYRGGHEEMRFQAAPFKAVDTAGASDVFIGALAVWLSEGNSMRSSIEFATYAAGLSVTHDGALPSIPFRNNVLYYRNQFSSLLLD